MGKYSVIWLYGEKNSSRSRETSKICLLHLQYEAISMFIKPCVKIFSTCITMAFIIAKYYNNKFSPKSINIELRVGHNLHQHTVDIRQQKKHNV